ncbi:hypothetical protein [Sphingomonas gellani]|nr:hypothetical protein [Sphingomonas gellani]
MQVLIDALSAVMATVSLSLIAANVFVIVATIFHRRRVAMHLLAHFARVIALLRLSDGTAPSRPYRRW